MNKIKLSNDDLRLIKETNQKFQTKLEKNWHGVCSGILFSSGEIITGFVLETENPSLTVCAEPIAIGKALEKMQNQTAQTIVAVRKRETTEHKIIPPCGRCREFITDYFPDINVIIFDSKENEVFKVCANDLLPYKYSR